jgi:hypothetical protein
MTQENLQQQADELIMDQQKKQTEDENRYYEMCANEEASILSAEVAEFYANREWKD